jgi:hypothetical protein
MREEYQGIKQQVDIMGLNNEKSLKVEREVELQFSVIRE